MNAISKARPAVAPQSAADPVQPPALIERCATVYRTWIVPYSRVIAAVVIAVLAVIVITRAVQASRTEREGQAFASLSKAEDVEAYGAVAAKHAGTAAAWRAQLEAARRLQDAGKHDQAADKFALTRSGSTDPVLVVAASFGEAYALEAGGKGELAEKRFVELAQSRHSGALTVDAWLGAGRCARVQGKLGEAEKYIERAREAVGDDRFAMQRVDAAMAALHSARHAERAASAPVPVTETPAPDPAPAAVVE